MFPQLRCSLRLRLPDEDRIVEVRLAQSRCKCMQRRLCIFDTEAVRLTDNGDTLILAVEVPVDPVDPAVVKDPHASRKVCRVVPGLAQLIFVHIPGPVPGKSVEHGADKSVQRSLPGLISTRDDIDPRVQRQFVVGKLTEMFQIKLQYLHNGSDVSVL